MCEARLGNEVEHRMWCFRHLDAFGILYLLVQKHTCKHVPIDLNTHTHTHDPTLYYYKNAEALFSPYSVPSNELLGRVSSFM